MRDRSLILAGLLLFLGLITFPIWYNLASGTSSNEPALKLPADEKQCVASKETMRDTHMEILMTWRDEVVRQDKRTMRTADGRTFEMSLTRTCLKCHDNKEEFCDKCHLYAGVTPYCWDCHIDPKLARRANG
jgi:hypothetical protein